MLSVNGTQTQVPAVMMIWFCVAFHKCMRTAGNADFHICSKTMGTSQRHNGK